MTKKILGRIAVLILAAIVLVGSVLTVSAESSQYVPNESYTYWNDITGAGRKLVSNRAMFETETVFDAKKLGVENFSSLIDICTDKNGYVYLLDTASRIIVLDENYVFVKEITSISGEKTYTFNGARNIYVHSDGTIYICDTENKRVLHCNNNGVYIDIFELPDSPLIPSDFTFKPMKVVADSRNYVYILSEGSYYGALLYAPDKSFIGFYGANTVTNGILGALQSLMNRMFPNEAKSSKMERTLPFVFSDIVIDSKDFIYTATDSASSAQIKKLNPGAGTNILGSDGVNFIDDGVNRTYNVTAWKGETRQRITGLEVDEDEFMYCLDTTYGRIFLYDSENRMITAFGGGMGDGTQQGTFKGASGIALKGKHVLVCDSIANTFTVFKRNAYGDKVLTLDKLTIDGDYVESLKGWEEVLTLDKNLQVAYTGIARAYLAEEKYEEAMEMALEGYDRDTYALAYEYRRTELVSENFGWIFAAIVLLIGVIVAWAIISSKREVTEIKGTSELRLMLNSIIHPGIAFEEIKDKRRGSTKLATLVLLVFYAFTVMETLWGGFLFTNFDPGTFNSLWAFVRSAGLVILWAVANWLVCTLAGGKGHLKEIFVVTCYALIPMILKSVLYIALSNILLPTEGSFLSIITIATYIWTGLILIIGMLRIHDFTMGRFIGTSLLTVIGMAAIVFLLILVGILLQQLGGFLVTVFIELLM